MTVDTAIARARADQPGLHEELVAIRRELHAHPEVGLNLPKTQATVLDELADLDLEITVGEQLSSVVAVLRGTKPVDPALPRRSVLLRADMDALPVVEKTGLPFSSQNGNMHACGHDLHVAGLLGAAKLLSAARSEIAGDVILMFQPGEEGYDGAKIMLDEGVLAASGNYPDAVYGVHVLADLPTGLVMTRPGPYMAAYSQLNVTVHGRGGHGSRPHDTLDPIQVAAEIIGSLQTYVTRRFNVFNPVILTVGEFHAGTATNVVPDMAEFRAGVRYFTPAIETRLASELPELIQGIAEAHGLSAQVSVIPLLPAAINDPAEAELMISTATALFGADRIEVAQDPRTGSEDFAWVMREAPGGYAHFGAGTRGLEPSEWAPNHSPRAIFNDDVLIDQAVFLASMAINRLDIPAPAERSAHDRMPVRPARPRAVTEG
ncbi:M20 metallopeptidase family protein [Lysinibacter cavernae]|uniref:Hippurate hydrolase n=1 Tax=Lysinibacter cavernae TaxID=1640652 RepID=A0A7X5TT63_9MICO|nr:M20 family metallopeptidase [Lysinibacter cavernae]NIH53184.1 hippurate hydrolase [Lysinibacter cavernae]